MLILLKNTLSIYLTQKDACYTSIKSKEWYTKRGSVFSHLLLLPSPAVARPMEIEGILGSNDVWMNNQSVARWGGRGDWTGSGEELFIINNKRESFLKRIIVWSIDRLPSRLLASSLPAYPFDIYPAEPIALVYLACHLAFLLLFSESRIISRKIRDQLLPLPTWLPMYPRRVTYLLSWGFPRTSLSRVE